MLTDPAVMEEIWELVATSARNASSPVLRVMLVESGFFLRP